jgi:hypothetical protein
MGISFKSENAPTLLYVRSKRTCGLLSAAYQVEFIDWIAIVKIVCKQADSLKYIEKWDKKKDALVNNKSKLEQILPTDDIAQ